MLLLLSSLVGTPTGSLTLTPSMAALIGAIILSLAALLVWSTHMLAAVNRRLRAIEAGSHSTGASVDEPIPDEIVAAISAAAVATLGNKARIVCLSRSVQESHAWSVEGRRHIFHSHNPR